MRILDLGAHDGFVSIWLARQLREQGIEVDRVDGVELHPDGVATANRRLADDGFTGEFKRGLAEDAPMLFPLMYDIVIAYEIIEHVPDVDRFLGVCEHMLCANGRVYLSTPDGCFGSGQNPHHLRVYRSIDLFEVCRKRGIVKDMISGPDGVAVVSYAPSEQGPVAHIYCGAGWEPWQPSDIWSRGLGGSETAAVLLADALSRDGYTVTVYGEVEEGMFRQVSYRHHTTYDPQVTSDLTVVSRVPQLLDRPINSKRTVLWMHDTDYGPLFTREHADRLDAVYVLSEWHASHVEETYPFLNDEKITVTRNGIDPERFPVDQIPPTKERPHRAIYSSSPDRGLDLILELWPAVRERVPDAELVYCYSAVYDAVASKRPDVAAFRDKVRRLEDQPGVTNLGSLNQFALAGAMAKSRVWLAPSFNTNIGQPFMETYCIGAVEAAAAGCSLVMSNWGALPERCDTANKWELIDEPLPDSRRQWVDAIVWALEQDENVGVSQLALEQTWDGVAADVIGNVG